MKYEQALKIAEKVKALLNPHYERIEIAGSIRRKKNLVKIYPNKRGTLVLVLNL